ncbi:MAG: hypothetical protein D6770_09090 [Anaerolineae bacterium]|nr:MAG: hypothetical protein D6770_09090 [Anaerolineae bacterium]
MLRGRGIWRDFFIVYTVFSLPIILLDGLAILIYHLTLSKLTLLVRMFFPFYLLLVIEPLAIRVNYQLHWIVAALINLVVSFGIFLALAALYMMVVSGVTT